MNDNRNVELTLKSEWTIKELSEELGVSGVTVGSWLKSLGAVGRKVSLGHGYSVYYTVSPAELLSFKQQQQQLLKLQSQTDTQLATVAKADSKLIELTGEGVERRTLDGYVQKLRDDHSIDAMREVFNNAAGFFAMFGEKIAQVNEAFDEKDEQIKAQKVETNAWKRVTEEFAGRVAMTGSQSYRSEIREEMAYAEQRVAGIIKESN